MRRRLRRRLGEGAAVVDAEGKAVVLLVLLQTLVLLHQLVDGVRQPVG